MRSAAWPLILLGFLLSIGTGWAQATINSFVVTYTAPGYIIDADGPDGNNATNRNRIEVSAQINFTVNSSYTVNWALLNPAGTSVGSGSTVLGANVVGVRNVAGNITPSTALTPNVLYRARITVVDTVAGATVATQTESPGRTYVHFTGLAPATAARNAVTTVDGLIMDRDWLLETAPTRQKLPIVINYTVHRYDAWNSPPSNADIEVRALNPSITQNPGPGVLPGTWSDTTRLTLSVPSHTGGVLPGPASVSSTISMQFDPTGVHENYLSRIATGIEHLELPSPATWKSGGSTFLDNQMFVHMTGELRFGSFTGTILSLISVANGPPTAYIPGGALSRNLTIGSGEATGNSNYTFTGLLGVTVNDGIAYCRSGESLALTPSSALARLGVLNGVAFNRSGSITLDSTGAHLTEILADLPVGVGWAADRVSGYLQSELNFGATDLDQNLAPAAALTKTSTPGTFFLCEETKPLYVGCPELRWEPSLGEFQAGPLAAQAAYSIRQPLMDWLNAQAVTADLKEKRSNDHLYNKVTAVSNAKWKKGTSGGGEMTGVLLSLTNRILTHFPYNTELTWNGGFIGIDGDLINPATSGFTGTTPAFVLYGQHCLQSVLDGCGAEEYGNVTVTPPNYRVTADGGIQCSGPPTMDPLAWGYISANSAAPDTDDFAHRVTTAFPSANFLMAGTFLRGDQNPLSDEDGPGVLLLSGFDPATLTIPERPGGSSYEAGLADYAGVNFRCDGGTSQGLSTLQDSAFGPYSLTTRSKYYARWGGVTGIHEAPAGGFPGTAVLGGYPFAFDSFAFSFLSTEMEESRAGGTLSIDAPVDEDFEFSGLRFTCLGMLDSFDLDIPPGDDSKTFAYWDAPVTPYTAEFVAVNECDPGDGTTFVLGFKAHVAHFAEDVSGALGILPDGNFAVPATPSSVAADSVPTRLILPSQMSFAGPAGETYVFTPSQAAYFNNPDRGSDGSGVGYWSFFGGLDVPFFRDVAAHVHTRCRESSSAMLDIMGGWPSSGWTDASGDPFSSLLFDLRNAGYPWDTAGTTTENYRAGNTTSHQWLPRAQQEWLGGLINFDYPLAWNSTTRDFQGVPLTPLNLLVLNAEHQLTYLSAENAELEFGLQYGDLPSISLANLAFTALDEATNFGSDWVTSQADKVFDGLNDTADEFAGMLEDKAEALVDEALDRVLDPWLDALINDLKAIPTTDPVAFRVQAELAIQQAILLDADNLPARISKLVDGTQAATDLLAELDVRLERIKAGLKGLTSALTVDPSTISISDSDGTPLASAATGLLAPNATTGEREALTLLASALIDLLSTVAVDAGLETSLRNVLEDLDPSIGSIAEILEDLHDSVARIQTEVRGAGEVVVALRDILASPSAAIQLNALATQILPDIQLLVNVPDVDLAHLTSLAEEWRTEISRQIRDALYGHTLIAQVQTVIRERLYDLQQTFNQAVDSAFAAVNQAVREALEPVLAELDTGIDNLLGDIGSKIGAGSIEGFAHFNGDSLDLLRLDGEFEFSLDEPVVIRAWLEIRELDSDGGTGSKCTAAGIDATEVSIGAENIGATFMNSDVRLDISTKFALNSSGLPIGLGGAFEMTEGRIGYETFSITELGATVMFGLTENYLGAKASLEFGSYEAGGGFFIGTTCDPDPLTLIDPLVEPLVSMPFSGIYAYGECSFPIFGTGTCLFNISGKAGAGVLYNSVIPEYGGRMTLGVTGEALCAVTVGGEVSLAGVKSGGDYNFAGRGRIFGEVGKCPFCVNFDKSVEFFYTDASGWDVDY